MGGFVYRAAVVLFLIAISATAQSQELTSTDVGAVGIAGSATASGDSWTVHGSGGDIWGNADAFQFVHRLTNRSGFAIVRVSDFEASNSFAKAGVMIRASLDPHAATAILDVRPDGGIEFMARTCTGCEMTFLGGATMTLPVYLTLFRDGTTYTASVLSGDLTTQVTIGSVDVTMPSPIPGLAVTSHNPNNAVAAIFDNPPR